MSPLNVLTFGASRNIGYLSAVRLLEKGATVTFLLRSPAVFDEDALIQAYIKSGKVRIVKGDATNEADVRCAWDEAGVVDVVLFTVGGVPSFHIFKGIVFEPRNLVTQCILNVLCNIPAYSHAPQPKIIVISSSGMTTSSHAALPLILKPLYLALTLPHRDKVGMERVIAHCAGIPWDSEKDGGPVAGILEEGWMERKGLPAPGTLKSILVVRPALLTDGKCVAEEGKEKSYRVNEEELGGYTVSRKDVSHFVVDALGRWDEFEGKRVNIAY